MIILSQKIDSDSTYDGDEIFKTYHFPRRYRNQIHVGDSFIYYQGNRHNKAQRYYFGMGRIGNIIIKDEDNYYADLINVVRFEKKVPIYLPNKGYIESLGYNSVRKSINPPWQSSIRPLSEEAYRYILLHSGCNEIIEEYNDCLTKAIQKYFVEKNNSSLFEIIDRAQQLVHLLNL